MRLFAPQQSKELTFRGKAHVTKTPAADSAGQAAGAQFGGRERPTKGGDQHNKHNTESQVGALNRSPGTSVIVICLVRVGRMGFGTR